MKLIERRGEYLIMPHTNGEMAALYELAGRHIEVSRSASHEATDEQSSAPTPRKVS